MREDCAFLEEVSGKQQVFWLTLLGWWLGIAAFLAVVPRFRGVPNGVIMAVFYGSALLMFLPARALYRLRCPRCRKPAGALPWVRYRTLICRSCVERIECKETRSD